MPVDAALIATRLGKPGDLRHPVTDRDQKHPTVSAATQANTRDLAKWHVDHAAHPQPVLVQLSVFTTGEGPVHVKENAQPLPDDFSITSSLFHHLGTRNQLSAVLRNMSSRSSEENTERIRS